jgi:hypothetical protein
MSDEQTQGLGAISGSREPSRVAPSRPIGFDPERENVDYVLSNLTDEQRSFLLHGEPTTDWQTATPEEWDGPLYCDLYVEKDYYSPLWLGSKDAHYKGDGGPWHLSYRYTDLGLAVRAASVDRSPEGQDAQRLDAKHESAVGSEASETPHPSQNPPKETSHD